MHISGFSGPNLLKKKILYVILVNKTSLSYVLKKTKTLTDTILIRKCLFVIGIYIYRGSSYFREIKLQLIFELIK